MFFVYTTSGRDIKGGGGSDFESDLNVRTKFCIVMISLTELGFEWGDQNRGKMVKIKVNVTSFW